MEKVVTTGLIYAPAVFKKIRKSISAAFYKTEYYGQELQEFISEINVKLKETLDKILGEDWSDTVIVLNMLVNPAEKTFRITELHVYKKVSHELEPVDGDKVAAAE